MGVVVVPYHQDGQLEPGTIPVPATATGLTPDLPDGGRWERIAALHRAVADAVVAGDTTVVSGDCVVPQRRTGPAVPDVDPTQGCDGR
jgi:hypothetical protein